MNNSSRGGQLVKKAEEIEPTSAAAGVSSDEESLKLMMTRIEGQAYRAAADSNDNAESYLQRISDQFQFHLIRTRSTINHTLNAHILINTIPNETLGTIFSCYVEAEELESSKTVLIPAFPKWYNLMMVTGDRSLSSFRDYFALSILDGKSPWRTLLYILVAPPYPFDYSSHRCPILASMFHVHAIH
ncbi:hypothetical protein SISSUDRAFT_889227 [Sistotremastrum suecicum HHB10207 ss-3]|uniref:Uncharacterized protein n=1 Tax=Sistotremastrum suecicum HHB10207 ss-3 TaxID=1314776 RepID=A0A166C477_9AGAM|nr:hypothetical protein SISSUDRAFT_889227 [Sistotremastrum suecicum HHB10207 ss-3]